MPLIAAFSARVDIVKFVSIFIALNIDYLVKHWKWFIFAFVYSRLCYGSEIYGHTYQTHLSKLHNLNNKILRILQNKPRYTYVIELHKTYNTNTIHDIHKLQILILLHIFSPWKETTHNL